MSIRLVSISHKTAPLEVRELFAFTKEQQEELMRTLISEGRAAESVVISTYNRTVHFTPLWFPDAANYTIYTQVWDTWTPDGMLSVNLNDYVSIQGSLYDDWYTNRE